MASTVGTRERLLAGCSKRPFSKAAGESKPEAYPLGYVEDFDEPRTLLADFFSILVRIIVLSPTATWHTLGRSRTGAIRIVAVTHKRKDSSCASLSPVW